jgi:hypothetical protein
MFLIDFECTSVESKCAPVKNIFIPEESINISPLSSYNASIRLNITEDIHEGDYKFSLKVKSPFGSVYDSIPLTVSVTG